MAISHSAPTTISFAENNDSSHLPSSTTTAPVAEYTNNQPSPCSDLFDADLPPQHSQHPQSQATHGKMPFATANSAHSGSCDSSSTTTAASSTTTTTSSTTTTTTTESTILSTWEPSPAPAVETLPCQQTFAGATTVTARYEFTPGRHSMHFVYLDPSPLFTVHCSLSHTMICPWYT
ncbi:MAG: hypothetical protein BYD32DRAFT_453224 [Podila humilis]|nr:MAG: hypothetical protein BYD32DRAFT_453224 [Podila humilis]